MYVCMYVYIYIYIYGFTLWHTLLESTRMWITGGGDAGASVCMCVCVFLNRALIAP